MIDFDRPGLLLLIPPAIFFLWLGARRSLVRWTPRQAAICLALRALIVVLLGFALAGPRFVSATRETAVVFLRDISGSMDDAAARHAEQFIRTASAGHEAQSAEIVFASDATVARSFKEAKPASSPNTLSRDATDLSSALTFAASVLPSDHPGRIVLCSDGVAAGGSDPLGVIAGLREKGIEIDTVPSLPVAHPEAAVTSIKTPTSVREGEMFDLTATVHSAAPSQGATLRLFQNNLLVAELHRDLPAGETEVVFQNVRAEGRLALYEVEVSAADDTRAENNRKKSALAHGGPARVLIVDANPTQSEPLASALRATGASVEIRPPSGFPSAIEEMEAFDLIVFCDAPATDFSDGRMKLIEEWVKNFGGGFLMIGGADSFGAGGWFRTPVAALLPVRIEREEREETPIVALLVILDRSGSMSAPAGGQTKMALANEGAILALDVLQSKDLFGLFAVDTRVQDVVPLARVGEKQSAARRIAGISAGGGGIYIYTSLAEAVPRLRDAKAKIKHIILFSDAADAEEKSAAESGGRAGGTALDLAAALLASRITLSVVALGNEQDRDTAFLRQLAGQGGGRFYLTPDATSLPRIFTLETMRAAESSLREDAFLPAPSPGQPVLRGIDWANVPLLLGFNVTKLKPGADSLLTTERGEPLLAEWRYGLGRVGAFTSDAKARWAAEWISWPGYGKFWSQIARELSQPGARSDLVTSTRETTDGLVIEAEAVSSEGNFRDGLEMTASIASPGSPAVSVPMPQVAPGVYRAKIKRPDSEPTIIAVSDGFGKPTSLAWTRDYPAEYQVGRDGVPLLKKLSSLTSGRFDPAPSEVFRPAGQPARTRRDLSPLFLLLAVLLWPVDIWLRRRDWGPQNALPPFSPAN